MYNEYYEKLIEKNVERQNEFVNNIIFSHYENNYYTNARQIHAIKYNFIISSNITSVYEVKGFIVEIYIDNVHFKSYFNQLKALKEEIETNIGQSLVWQERPTICRIFAKSQVENIEDKTKWNEYIDWQINTMIKFLQVFPQYTTNLRNEIGGEFKMLDYEGYKKYLIRIGIEQPATWLSYISQNKLEILNSINGYQNLSNEQKIIKFSNEASSFKTEFDNYHNFASATTFNDLRSGARRYKYYLQYLEILKTMNKYDIDKLELNGAYVFFEIFNSGKYYPVKSICNKNIEILELDENFTTDEARDILNKIFNKEQIINIRYLENRIIPESSINTKNIILYGVPGVGKTHNITKLINLIEKNKDSEQEIFSKITQNDESNELIADENLKSRVVFTTFHQSFAYEDFIEGFRPNNAGQITLRDGIFKTICEDATNDKYNNYYLVIDEINRGNISKIFGELITLIEESKRDKLEILLPYSQEEFSVPSNLFIIGTMNSTDKSIALIDIALRRRFTFLELKPNETLIQNPDAKEFFIKLNEQLEDDYKIGHSYFMGENIDLKFVKEYKIKPLLKEYFYGNNQKLEEIMKNLEY